MTICCRQDDIWHILFLSVFATALWNTKWNFCIVVKRSVLKPAHFLSHFSEYYFSEENLVRDFFLRRKMDSDGYLPITLIASFHRVQALTNNFSTVVEAISESDKLELHLTGFKVRTKSEPLAWPISEELAADQQSLILQAVPPPPLPKSQRDNPYADNLNPDVAEFVPSDEVRELVMKGESVK